MQKLYRKTWSGVTLNHDYVLATDAEIIAAAKALQGTTCTFCGSAGDHRDNCRRNDRATITRAEVDNIWSDLKSHWRRLEAVEAWGNRAERRIEALEAKHPIAEFTAATCPGLWATTDNPDICRTCGAHRGNHRFLEAKHP